MFFDNVSGLMGVLVVGPLAHLWLIAVVCSAVSVISTSQRAAEPASTGLLARA